jgi:hypothetical protein
MGRGNMQKMGIRMNDAKRVRPTRNQPPPPTLPNVDVPGLIFAVLAVVFVVYPLAQYFLGL